MKGEKEFFLAVSIEGLDATIWAKIATGCLHRFRPIYAALHSLKACFKGIFCEQHACFCVGKFFKVQQLNQ